MKAAFLLGRLLFGGYFLYSGIHHFKDHEMVTQYAASKKVPAPDLAVTATGIALIVGGTSILLGVKPKLGTAAVLSFLAGVSPIMHNFWSVQDTNQRMQEMVNFTKNLALAGGTLALMGVEEPWPVSVPVERSSGMKRLRKMVRKIAA